MNDERLRGITLYVATGKQKHGEADEAVEPPPVPGDKDSPLAAMTKKLKSESGQAIYKMRKAIVEPVFGQIKEWRRFRRFSLRGKGQAKTEWQLICLTHNLLGPFRSGRSCQTA